MAVKIPLVLTGMLSPSFFRQIACLVLAACVLQATGCTRMTLNKKRGTSSAVSGGGGGGGGGTGPAVTAYSPSAPSVPLVYVNDSDKSAVDFSVSCTAGNTIDLQITDSGAGSITPPQQTCGVGGTYDFTGLDLSSLAEGVLSVLITEVPAAGGAPLTGTLSLTKDTVAPVLAGLGNSTTPAQTKTWSWSCADAGSSNTCTYRFVAPGTSATGSPTGAYASTATASQSTGDGTYYVHVEGRDAAGNSSGVVTSSALIDNTPPVVILSAKADRWDGSGTLSFAMISDEILSGVETSDIQNLQSGPGFSVALTSGTSGLSSYFEADYTGLLHAGMVSFLYLPAGVVSDLAGNATTAASLYSIPLAAGGSRENIQFEYSSYGFSETEASPVVRLKASGAIPYDVVVGIRTLDNGRTDAQWGTEYTGLAGSTSARVGTVTLTAGQTEATLNLQLLKTLAFGQSRRIHLALISTDSPALVIGERDEASILIRGTSPDTMAGAGADWIQVARGLDHACQLNSRGQIKCWGLNATGQLGTGGVVDSPDPVEISGGRRYVAVDAGTGFNCAIDEEAQVWCWGSNGSGQLGDGSQLDRLTPTAITVPTGTRFIQISIGKLSVCALSDDHQVYCWGDAPFTSTPAVVTSVAALGVRSVDMGGGHLCVVAHDSAAYCLGGPGSDGFGALGDGPTDSSGAGFTLSLVTVSGGLRFTSVVAGTDFSCGIAISGETYCWGLNDVGQLGNGTPTDSDAPVQITPSLQLREIWARNNIACGISVGGKLMCWGDGQNTPHEIMLGSSAAARRVSPGQASGCAIDPLGEVYCWVNVPSFATSATRVSDPSPDAAVEGVLGAAMGSYHSCLTTTSGKTQCWGTINSNKLVGSPMQDMPVANSLFVVGGEDYALIQTTAGKIYSFGGNADKQLGRTISGPEPQETPYPIPTGTPAAPIEVLSATAGTTHGCVLPANHQPKCWGSNGVGQIGIASTGGTYTQPTTVPATLLQVSAGASHTCGVFYNGQLACWGGNSSGQLGDTTTTDRNSPTPVSLTLMPVSAPDRAFIKVSAGYNHTCAITTVGNAFCWGANQHGQLGDGVTADRYAPDFSKPVGSISDRYIDIVASQSAEFACAITSDYRLVCWGRALGGVLGHGNPDLPGELSPSRRYRAVFANHDTCAIRTDGVFECFGSSPVHQSHPSLGSFAPAAIADPLALDKRFAVEVTPESTRQWRQISTARAFAAGQYGTNTCAIDLQGELHCWGIGFGVQGGQLGDWGSELRSHPVVVDAGIPYQSVSVSETFACGVTTGGQLKCWGGPVGGVGSAVNYASLVDGSTRYTRVSAGNDFACAITVGGGVRCWGAGSSGQLGNGGTTSSASPVSVAFPVGVGTIQKLAAGFVHACAVDHLQKLWCWGSDSHGQVGDGTVGTPVEQSTPVQVGSADHVDVVAGYRHTCSIKSDATVRCWGDNTSNQIGQGGGGLPGYASPTAVSGVTAVSQLAVSREPAATDTCAVTASGELYCWGLGSGGVPSGVMNSAPLKASMGQYSRVAMSSYGGCGIETSETLSCWSTITGPYKNNSLGNGYFYGLPFPIK